MMKEYPHIGTSRGYGLTPKGEPMPQTIDEWKHLVDLGEEAMLRDKVTISKLKQEANKLSQKIQKYHTVYLGVEALIESLYVEVEVREISDKDITGVTRMINKLEAII